MGYVIRKRAWRGDSGRQNEEVVSTTAVPAHVSDSSHHTFVILQARVCLFVLSSLTLCCLGKSNGFS